MSTSQTIERTALSQLVTNEQYARKVLPFIKGAYFADKTERTVFEEIAKFVDKYQTIPTQTSLEIEVQSRKDLNEEEFKKIVAIIQTNFVRIGRYIMRLSKAYQSLMERIRIEGQMLFRAFSQMPLLLVLITVLVMIICWMQMNDMISTTR